MSAVAQQLRAAAGGLAEAARKDAIEPEGTLGHWVQSQGVILQAQADLAEHIEQQVMGAVSESHKLAKVEVEKLRQMIGLAHLALEAAKSAEASFDLRKELVLSKVVVSVRR